MKRVGKIMLQSLAVLTLIAAITAAIYLPAKAAPGEIIGENKIPVKRDSAAAPYAVFQAWLAGGNTGKCYEVSSRTLKFSATYANCAVRAEQDSVTKLWWITVPPELDSGTYIVIIRDGAAGAESNSDTDVAAPVIAWDKNLRNLKTTLQDVLANY